MSDLRFRQFHSLKNVLNLVIVVGYVNKRLDNARVLRYLSMSSRRLITGS